MDLIPYLYKTPPRSYQKTCFERSRDMEAFAILFEQGCGKSKVVVDTAAYLYQLGRINAVVVIAPKGVHDKWITEDFPLSFPDHLPYRAALWQSDSARARRQCDELMSPGHALRLLCMNVEAFSHKTASDFLKRFLLATDALLVIDESSRIKTPTAMRTKALIQLGDAAKYRRILTGTPISNSPFDYYAQFQFLDPDILGATSFYAFKAEYAETLDEGSGLMRHIREKQKAAGGSRFTPQIVAKDANGKPRFKNLDKLKALIAPYSARVTKDEVLPELPPKIFTKRLYSLPEAHRKAYDTLKNEMKLKLAGETVTVMQKMTLLLRLQQLTCGYVPNDEGKVIRLYPDPRDNPRIQLLLDTLEDIDGQVIIWCRFRPDIRDIASVLGDAAVTYYGDTVDRADALDQFRSGAKRFFVGNAVVGGIGLNLVNSSTCVYYSNTFSYEDRKQSEDRVHRIGQKSDSVLYVDLEAENTVDAKIIAALKAKEDLAHYMTDLPAWAEYETLQVAE